MSTCRTFSGAVVVSTLLLALAVPPPCAAAPPRYWMPLQSNGPGWQLGQTQPLSTGQLSELEHANGIRIDLNDFTNSAPKGDGTLYLSMSDNVSFTTEQCLKDVKTNCVGSTLFVGLKVHAATAGLGSEKGEVILYLDGARQASLDGKSCKSNNQPTSHPADEDRKIVITYESMSYGSNLKLTIKQLKGDCAGDWKDITDPANDPGKQAFKVTARASERTVKAAVVAFLNFEVEVHAQPRGALKMTSQIVKDKIFGLGVLHRTFTSVPGDSFAHLPSIFQQPPTDLNTLSWATIDMGLPERISLKMSAWNVGQLQIVEDGGQGEEEDIAKLIYKNDITCLTEEMEEGEREDVVSWANKLRFVDGLPPLHAVYLQDGDPPNNMILSAFPILDSGGVLYGHLPDVSVPCADSDCIGDGAGKKGIVWARLAIKKAKAVPPAQDVAGPGKPETWSSEHFIDVFCTHTQADYESDGQWAWVREEQFAALRAWAKAKRAGGNGAPNGLDRPAFVLGDLNQIAPKGVAAAAPNMVVENWVKNTQGKPGFGTAYKSMRAWLGNWSLSAFDKANGWAWDLYDLLALDGRGTWIGQGTESAIPSTSANDCITPGQPSGYDTVSQLPKEARVDYILVLPAEGSFPFYSLTGPEGQPDQPIVKIYPHAGSWFHGEGCASDHAEVTADIGLVTTLTKANYNPMKGHRLTYRVSHLMDVNVADGADTEWYSPEFRVYRWDAGTVNVDDPAEICEWGKADDQYNEADSGVEVEVNWSCKVSANGEDQVRAGFKIADNDSPEEPDIYDGTSFESELHDIFIEPYFEFDHTYPGTFRFTGGLLYPPWGILGTADASPSDPDGSCKLGCLGVITEGDGDGTGDDDNARVTQSLYLEEID